MSRTIKEKIDRTEYVLEQLKKKTMVKEPVAQDLIVSILDLDGLSFDEVLAKIEGMKTLINVGGYSNVEIDINIDDCGYDCYPSEIKFVLIGDREETTSEAQKRKLAAEKKREGKKKREAKKLEAARKKYEKLKEKFEGDE